jgi:hypothetical protein
MKKNYKALLYSKFTNGSYDLMSGRAAAINPDYHTKRRPKKRIAKPNLHKIGVSPFK